MTNNISTSAAKPPIDFKAAFEALPGICALIQVDAPRFTILSVTEEFIQASGIRKEELVGKGHFEPFPKNPDDPYFSGEANLRASYAYVLANKKTHQLPVQRYDIPTNAGFAEHYWSISNKPVLDNNGDVIYIIHTSIDITDKVKAEKREAKIKEIEKGFQLFMQAPVAVCIVKGLDYVVELANEDMLQFLGRNATIIGKPIIEALPEAKVQGLIDILDGVRTTGHPYYASAFPATPLINGVRELRYFNLIFKLFYQNDDDIESTSIFCVAHNVTELVLARQKIKESEEELQLAFDIAELGAFRINLLTDVATYSNRIMNWFGFSEQGLSMKVIPTYVHPDDRANVIYALQQSSISAGQAAHNITYRVISRKDGTERHLRSLGRTLFKDEGKPYLMIGVIEDVTKQMLYQKHVQESEHRYRTLIEEATIATALYFGRELTIQYANNLMTEYWGKDAAVLGKPLSEAVPELKDQPFFELLDEVFTTGKPYIGKEEKAQLFIDGKLQNFYFNFTYKALRNKDGEIYGIHHMAVDVTEQVLARLNIEEIVAQRTEELAQANEALIKSNKDLGRSNANLEEFAYAASHDLKEPVRKIHFFTERLRTELVEQLNENQQRLFGRMEQAAQRMEKLIDDLLLYSHIGKGGSNMETVDLNKKVAVVLEDLELEIEEKKADITVDELPAIKGYRRQLQQLFQNLISNALKYNKAGIPPQVHISSTVIKGKDAGLQLTGEQARKLYYLIEVKDNGIGFEKKYAERIFNVFTRLHGNAEYKGTGVGLSIVRKVVENHDGFVWAESELGEGATFKLLLPVDEL
jgi:PAS domain S-box-containing protein